MFRNRILLSALLASLLALGAIGAAPALASHGQATYFEGSTDLLNPAKRARAIAQLQALGVKALRVELDWYDVAPGQKQRDQADLRRDQPRQLQLGRIRRAVRGSQAAGLESAADRHLAGPALGDVQPQSAVRDQTGSGSVRKFMTAVGRHFGSEVSLYSIWNEPNHPAFLLPQWNTNGTPASPRIYRGLYQAGYAGLQAAGLSRPPLLFGETAPTGYTKINYKREKSKALLHDVAPLAFLRKRMCLNAKYKKSPALARR